MLWLKRCKWKEGIPHYKEQDLMTEQELFDFAVNVVMENELIPGNFEISKINRDPKVLTNIIARKGDTVFYIIVRCAVAPKKPKLTVEEKKVVLSHDEISPIKYLYAPVSIGSADAKRFEASLALKNDKYLVHYTGFEEVAYIKDRDWINATISEIHKLNPYQDSIPNYNSGKIKYSQRGTTGDIRFSERNQVRYSDRNDIQYSDRTEAYSTWLCSVKSESFQERLLSLIGQKGMSNTDFYTAAYLDRKLFSAIKNNPDYQPKKETAVACCFGLKLNWSEAESLLELAGYKLSLSIAWDRVIYYCLKNGITDIDVVNEILYADGNKCIRV